jgi:hypothetical protein
MTYGRVRNEQHERALQGASVGRPADLVRGDFAQNEGPLIRPFGEPSPQEEKGCSVLARSEPIVFQRSHHPFIMLMSSTAIEPRLRK